MDDAPSRDEIAAKLEAAEARTEARISQLSGNLDGRFASLDVRFASLDVRFASLDHKIDSLADMVTNLTMAVKESRQEARAENSLTRKTIIAVSAGGILAGLAALWTTQANLLASFQAGLALQQLHASAPPK